MLNNAIGQSSSTLVGVGTLVGASTPLNPTIMGELEITCSHLNKLEELCLFADNIAAKISGPAPAPADIDKELICHDAIHRVLAIRLRLDRLTERLSITLEHLNRDVG